MDAVSDYIIRIFITISICSALTALLSGKSSKGIIKVICGIFITVSIVTPIIKLDFDSLQDSLNLFDNYEYEQVYEKGVTDANLAQKTIIKEQLTAYILDKAVSLQMSIEVDLTTTDKPPFIPQAIEIYGNYSPYSQKILSDYISDEIGIPKERQQWN